ncbi:GNAT family N-acetyltransferase [Burkholderiaceae bacterium DAT-1]|nr:GNAT family N-acetyltransferase [Burkholderiaceae bacterium DAT-1]
MQISIHHEQDAATFDALVTGVRAYNAEHLGAEKSQPLSVIAHDEAGKLIGGVAGRTIYKQFLIEVMWVDAGHRGTGLGRTLMQRAEDEARARGCVAAQVDTLSFQGPVFYGKLGFEVIGRITDLPGGHERLFMLKRY